MLSSIQGEERCGSYSMISGGQHDHQCEAKCMCETKYGIENVVFAEDFIGERFSFLDRLKNINNNKQSFI
jgi:hypothetical protein